jgi:hypothetical protein
MAVGTVLTVFRSQDSGPPVQLRTAIADRWRARSHRIDEASRVFQGSGGVEAAGTSAGTGLIPQAEFEYLAAEMRIAADNSRAQSLIGQGGDDTWRQSGV